MAFLDQVAARLQQQFPQQLDQLCLIVPTRRAVVFLKRALARTFQRTMWAPRILSIQDFVRESVGWQFPDAMPLVFELYQVYGPHMRLQDAEWYESFEQFYNWGEMLVKDFDEIDKYLVNAEQLFTNIKDLKEIEYAFDLPPENLESVRKFWQTLRGRQEEPSDIQLRFLGIWQELFSIYKSYQQALRTQGMGYDGMAYRELITGLQAKTQTLSYHKIIFLGFNALSTAEEQLMAHLLRTDQGMVFWDVDRAYFTPPEDKGSVYDDFQGHIAGEEPGKFIREYHKKWQGLDSHLIVHDMAAAPKDLYVTGVPLQVGQAQYAGNLLRQANIAPQRYQQHAIVLADENLLFPVLYALPAQISQFNITMGFPLRQTHVHDLLQHTLRLLRNFRPDAHGNRVFSYRDVRNLLHNPYFKATHPELSARIQRDITDKNWLFLSPNQLASYDLPPLWAHVFTPPPLPAAGGTLDPLDPLLIYCEEVFRLLFEDAGEREATLETEYLFQFYQQFGQLRHILETYRPRLTLSGFTRLYRDILQRARIPFEGEPLLGVQLMGFLETRVLDFDHLYILASNEGKLPDTSTGNSFVPYNLRKGFGLPTYEEKDAIYAYHFYRLIQRAKEVHLIYDTVVQDGGSQEVSRFIQQIRHFFRGHPHLKVHERLVTTPAPYVQQQGITIPQTADTQAILAKTFLERRYLSATGLTTYMTCPLRFYFRYVAGIKEQEEVEESMEANTLGSVLHRVMELLYEPYKGKGPIGAETFNALPDSIDNCMRRAFDEQQLGWGAEIRGKNYLLREVIRSQCLRMLRIDAEGPTFEIVDLENDHDFLQRLPTTRGQVKINGAFDRIDYLPEAERYRIIDYKTGKIELAKKSMDIIFSDPKYKAAFQGYLYAWLFEQRYPGKEVQMGFYAVRHLGDGIQFLNEGKPIAPAVMDAVRERLIQLVETVWEEPFTQTEDVANCRICPYNAICNRR